MSFKIGQKVVCVEIGKERNGLCLSPLKCGEIYTVSGLCTYYIGDIYLVGFGTLSFHPSLFRPIVDIGSEVESYILEQIKQPVEA